MTGTRTSTARSSESSGGSPPAGCWQPDVDLFDDFDGRLSHHDSAVRLSSLLPLEVMLPMILGRVCYGNLPYSKIKPTRQIG